MTLRRRKNLIWLVVIVVLTVVISIHSLQHYHIQKVKEARRLFNAQAMRIAGVGGHALILDGTEHLSPTIIVGVLEQIKRCFSKDVASDDVAMWVDDSRVKLLLTSDELYCIDNGEPLYWKLADLKTVDWERRRDGFVLIGNRQLYVLMDYRKPFVEAMKKILCNCQHEPSGEE